MKYQLSSDQVGALKAIGGWYRAKDAPYITLGGYAGTGKTTLIAYVRQALRDNYPKDTVAFCAYTGKAVRVLDRSLQKARVAKTKDYLGTLHSLIYSAEVDGAGRFKSWRKKDTLDHSLVIVDEASMVSEDIWQDLLSFDVPVLAVGDHGQLPPIGSPFNLMAEPQLRLERVYRQEALSPIIAVATMARTSGQIDTAKYGDGVIKYNRASDDIGLVMEELLEAWRPDWLVLCGYNHTRVRLNADLRKRMELDTSEPTAGDKVICLRNNRTAKLYNGMTGTIFSIESAEDDPDKIWWRAVIDLDDMGQYEGLVLRAQFGAKETVKSIPLPPGAKANRRGQVRGDLFDFGYALTVHKAQGSSADTVLVFEERNQYMSDDDWRRWLYTAVTRAERQLFILGSDNKSD